MNRKKRLYMRGIGVGIFIAALILIIARINTPAQISDAEIISRAHELGMIESDSMSLTESAGNTDVQEPSSSELYPVLVPTGNNDTDQGASVSSESSAISLVYPPFSASISITSSPLYP